MKMITALLVDAFTSTPGQGNRAGVVLDAEGLTSEEMQAVAALINVSETAFMLPPPEAVPCDLEVRYFTPTVEVPTCGHATIASFSCLPAGSGPDAIRRLAKTGAGILAIDTEPKDGGMQVTMTQGEIVFTPEYDAATRTGILSALGLGHEDLIPDLPIQEVSTGHSKVMIPIRSVQTLDRLTPDMDTLTAVSRAIECNGFFVFAFNGPDDPCLTSGRMFAPAIGIDEDPVTGNGNGPCGAYLSRYGLLPDAASHAYLGRQGVAMGKEGIIKVTVGRENGQPVRVQVGGTAVLADHMEIAVAEVNGKASAKRR